MRVRTGYSFRNAVGHLEEALAGIHLWVRPLVKAVQEERPKACVRD